jgi:hypothetical protein
MKVLARIGVLFTLLGFGSLILEQMDMEFRILAWAEDIQPTFGLVLGAVGLTMIAGAVLIGRTRAATQQPPAQASAQLSHPQQDGGQQPGQVPGAPQPGTASWRPPAPCRAE